MKNRKNGQTHRNTPRSGKKAVGKALAALVEYRMKHPSASRSRTDKPGRANSPHPAPTTPMAALYDKLGPEEWVRRYGTKAKAKMRLELSADHYARVMQHAAERGITVDEVFIKACEMYFEKRLSPDEEVCILQIPMGYLGRSKLSLNWSRGKFVVTGGGSDEPMHLTPSETLLWLADVWEDENADGIDNYPDEVAKMFRTFAGMIRRN